MVYAEGGFNLELLNQHEHAEELRLTISFERANPSLAVMTTTRVDASTMKGKWLKPTAATRR